MKYKGLYVLALVMMLGVAAGCGKDAADDALEESKNKQVTEAVVPDNTPSETSAETATPLPTATTAPTATPVPQTYMEKNNIEVRGAGRHTYQGFIRDRENTLDKNATKIEECECLFEVWEEDNGDGTKTIYANISGIPYVYEDGDWCVSVMTGFVDIKTGKSYVPYDAECPDTTYLKQEEDDYEITVILSMQHPSEIYPYCTDRYMVVCPSDYEDAGFYLTGYNRNWDTYMERTEEWRLLNYVRHGLSDMVVFGVKEGLATMPLQEPAKEPVGGEPQTTEGYFEKNQLTVQEEGKFAYLGTVATYEINDGVINIEDAIVETKEVESEFCVTEELQGDGTKIIRGKFTFMPDIVTEGRLEGGSSLTGFVDKKTGLSYRPFALYLAEQVMLEQDGRVVPLTVACELAESEEEVTVTWTVVCPEDYEDAAFYITGNYLDKEVSQKTLGKVVPIDEVEHGESDLLFFE